MRTSLFARLSPAASRASLRGPARSASPALRLRRTRSGNYAVMFGLAMTVMLGFGAFAIDLSYLRLTEDQVQDVADAASQAAMITLKRGGTTADATTAATLMLNQNVVGGRHPRLQTITFGVWDETASSFTQTNIAPNAVRVKVTRDGTNSVPMFLSKMWGRDSMAVTGNSTSAARKLHTILNMDITGSWSQKNFANARAASIAFMDVLTTAYGDEDMVGMVIFTGPYAWEYSPFRLVKTEAADHKYRTSWGLLNVASKSTTTPHTYPAECTVTTSNIFTYPTNTATDKGGCYPKMPREYTDEPGTDHTTGMTMARTMINEQTGATVYNAMVTLTDGIPNGITASEGKIRATPATKYTETRWREYIGPRPHTTSQIQTDSVALSNTMWAESRTNQWVISFLQDGTFMHNMVHGNGTYTLATSSAQLIPVFQQIARSLPIVIVY